MLSIDDRAANVMTTLVLFLVAAAILYRARTAFFILLLSLLFAYLLEPAVGALQRRSRLGRGSRSLAIAKVYVAGYLVLATLGYQFGPRLVGQIKSLNAALPKMLHDLSDEPVVASSEEKQGSISTSTQHGIHNWLSHHHDWVTTIVERGAASAIHVAASATWLFVVPILAIFILRDRRQLEAAIIQTLGQGRAQASLKRILDQINSVLAKYIRAQLALAGLSFLFYSVAMLALKFPYAVALGFFGGVLEFLPAIGWVASAATILTIGFLTHAHWTWMAALLILWRIVQDYVNSPRIMGNTLQLQPLTVLFALMVGGQVGGIAGLYLSVPAVAVLRIVWLGCSSAGSSSDAIPD